MGLEATLLRPEPAFRGLWGTWYLDRTIYHHGSGSFNSSADARLLRQYATWRRDERFYRRRVARGEYDVGATTAALRGIRPRLTASATRGVAAVRRCVDQSHADRRNTS
jgi:hypothetical protein